MNVADLPLVNACLNGLSASFLIAGFWMIRRKRPTGHRNCMIAAFCCSAVFLCSYLFYHWYRMHHQGVGVTRFPDLGMIRTIYLAILTTHTLLAVVIVPLIFSSLYFAWRGRFESHRKVARWTWPLWIYVSVTGVVIYLMLYQLFPPTQSPSPTVQLMR